MKTNMGRVTATALACAVLNFHPAIAADNEIDVLAAMQASFVAKRQAGMQRLVQDETQAQCTQYKSQELPLEVALKLAALNLATIKPPTDGIYFGDVNNGAVIAQRGKGLQSSDDPAAPAGGNCYACHELAGAELAFGTIGPSLHNYGKLRGSSPAMVEYTWSKLYNSNALTPCSNMPRFGHQGILTEEQLKDVMAYLFDANSPVNQ
jgi:sulfur-oxidizing protein SoxX